MEESLHDIAVTQQQPYCCSRSYSASTGMPCEEETCNSCKECNESSTNSTPFVSAPSSPRKSTPLGYYFTRATLTIPAPSEAYDIVDDAVSAYTEVASTSPSSPSLSEFEFSSRFSEADMWFNPSSVALPMSTAEELFHNGKIRPLNPRLCPSSTYCICFGDPICEDRCHDPHFYDTCHSYAYRDGPPSAYTEHHQQHHLLMRKQRLEHTKPTSALSALEQWKKSMGRYDKEHFRHAINGHHVERVVQIRSLPLACYRNSGGGHHRRARSLSPMRVFHMDDMMMQARASFDTNISHAVDGGTIMRHRRSRKSWTLKELLNMGDNKLHGRRPQLQGNFGHVELSSPQFAADNQVQANGTESEKFGSKEIDVKIKSAKDQNAGKGSLAEERLYSKSSAHHEEARSPWNLQKAPTGEHSHPCYSIGSQRAQVEEMKKRTFLRYKKGLLGCLGFTSKISSMKE